MRRAIAVAGLIMAVAAPIDAQAIRIAARVRGPMDSTAVDSALRSAFRGLGDVEVVYPDEPHDFVVSVVYTCQASQTRPAECQNFIGSFAVWQELTYSRFAEAVSPWVPPNQRVPFQLLGYRFTIEQWAFNYGRYEINDAFRGRASEVDSSCFEFLRTRRRLRERAERPDTMETAALVALTARASELMRTSSCPFP